MTSRPGAVRRLFVSTVLACAVAGPALVHAACGDGIVDAGEQCDDGNVTSGDCCSVACTAESNGNVCDDGNPCTTSSACGDGACIASGGDTRCGLDLDRFKCYQATPTPSAPRFVRRSVALSDDFETVSAVVTKARAICNPVNTNDEGIDDPTAHLACYSTVDDRRQRFLQRTVEVTSQFGVQQFRVLKPYQLCVPSEQGIVPDPPTPSALGLDHFRCYKASARSGGPADKPIVKLEDQFESRVARVGHAIRLCNPVDVEGAGILDGAAHLACYKLERIAADPVAPFVPKPTSIANQLGELALTARPLLHFCVPARTGVPAS
ncbi:MAG TPA: hypothetical protein VGR62_25560 [Candidatus Binatia bacterium]|jgi:cysteine-rich repeat protein|nr:hypothetical protein [Candidatus Binatia bacterium]